jgi:hypothetical protein
MQSTTREGAAAPTAGDTSTPSGDTLVDTGAIQDDQLVEHPLEHPLPSGLLADLDDPDLVLSADYIGTDRRQRDRWARIRRATFTQRRSLLRLEVVVAVVAVVIVASIMLTGTDGRASAIPTVASAPADVSTHIHSHQGAPVVSDAPPPTAPTPATTPATVPTPAVTTPAAATAPTPAATTPATTPPAATPAAPLTPDQLGAQALALVRYPWQGIPGYSIQFMPISDAPSPGFYGNTTFTWGQTGGTSVLYVYPGETVDTLAGITAFEIGHEVDAAAVYPQGGETQIENILGIHPASWAPDCDCAEQGFLSGWYAAAFSNYWSPGVGDWSTIAPEPSGATLAAVEPWLNPTIS